MQEAFAFLVLLKNVTDFEVKDKKQKSSLIMFKKNCFCSVISFSHLGSAKALAESLKASGNTEKIHVLITDSFQKEKTKNLNENIVLHCLDEIKAFIPKNLIFYFDKFELCNALKPFFVRHLFKQGLRQVIYLDADIFAVGSFGPAWQVLQQAPVVLTPHNLKPPALDLGYTTEIAVVDQGIYNGGFSAWRAGRNAEKVLDWMCSRFPVYGFNRRSQGMFVDQKLLPLLPIYFPESVLIWRNPSLNIAFWNVQERNVETVNLEYKIASRPVVFFHMSGYRQEFPHKACSYLGKEANQRILEKAPWFRGVMERYDRLLKEVKVQNKSVSYKYERFNGILLSPDLRILLFQKRDLKWYFPKVLWIILLDRLRLIKRTCVKVVYLQKDE